MSLPLMIFAAGRGTRMLHLTQTRPKPMIEVAGRPLIDHAIALGRDAGAGRIVANAHYLHERLAPHLRAQDVQVSLEWPDLLDTGGGLRLARPLLGDGPVWTLNSDMLWTGPNPLRALEAAWRPGMGALMMTVPLDRAHGRKGGGDLSLDAKGRLSFGGDLVYAGAQIIDPTLVEDIPDRVFSIREVWLRLADEGRLFGLVHPGHWADVGHPEGIAIAEDMLARA
ncbi:nucleotidyltransferase family protein [Palleronia caenipelagi]|uniref:Nucleotidyltransferase family protein n=1 Tax=Palleronia caenipelagi TaxID=2489174 RepID=A0A547Q6N1_9RHOB|nr:nucleotidyltransferase family protein [Palleronia caenipelagi]TRD22046.1 nucleotidyltransferase family protein [Palleronia caenipelagi]